MADALFGDAASPIAADLFRCPDMALGLDHAIGDMAQPVLPVGYSGQPCFGVAFDHHPDAIYRQRLYPGDGALRGVDMGHPWYSGPDRRSPDPAGQYRRGTGRNAPVAVAGVA